MARTRRDFLKLSAVGVAGLAVGWRRSGRPTLASVQIPQSPLPGSAIPKYVEPLPTFVGARVRGSALTVSMEELQQKVLPAGFYDSLADPYKSGTLLWGYRVGNAGPSYPGYTVEAQRGVPTTMTYINNLPLASLLQKFVTLDQTLHWANPYGLGMDDPARFSPYAGPPPAVVHLHGGEVPSSSDGGPDQWFTPLVAPGEAIQGPGYRSSTPVDPNAAVYRYPNEQEAATLWFHDHVLGATRLNVYCGLAAFYLVRDAFDTGVAGTGLNLPAGPQEIELAIQDRMFDTNGQLYFPDVGDNPAEHPFWLPEFFGDVIVVNGKTWPYLNVEPRRYRFRILDGSNARFYKLSLSSGTPFWQIGTDGGLLDKPVMVSEITMAPGERVDVIVDFASLAGQTIVLRNDGRVPFPSGDPVDAATTAQVMQIRVGATVTGGTDNSFNPAAPGATLRGGTGQPPAIVRLVNPSAGSLSVVPDAKRQLTLNEVMGDNGPLAAVLNNSSWHGTTHHGGPLPSSITNAQGDFVTEAPQIGSTEVWEIINLTGDTHPIHLHLVQFQLLNRQSFDAVGYEAAYNALFPGGMAMPMAGPPLRYHTPNAAGALGGNPDVTPFLNGAVSPPLPEEAGWKDTVQMHPGEVTRIAVRFAPQGTGTAEAAAGRNLFSFDPTSGPGYVWHCHIVDHEDNEMMRPMILQPLSPRLLNARLHLPAAAK